eukprot:CAMPEP_0172794628 /NCGR_PEP_ID=MMETSP1074-20121228/210072_1 /TAXON_ID=2916 /ORGANISM="Ceratium fusus, Strain PA161109" /LENGTH=101 /DNA_ID=CAMNT_0013631707 /DNA_START=1890 /DNA_END=2195 /DNA_ORIENTATION=-
MLVSLARRQPTHGHLCILQTVQQSVVNSRLWDHNADRQVCKEVCNEKLPWLWLEVIAAFGTILCENGKLVAWLGQNFCCTLKDSLHACQLIHWQLNFALLL